MGKLTCEVCGITSDERTGWIAQCPIHFGDICSTCCWGCKYMKKIGSLVHCFFRDSARESAERKEKEPSQA